MHGNTNRHWLTKFLFIHTPRQKVPDGRPLYAYKMGDTTYAESRTLFHQMILLDQDGKLTTYFASIFCLYAAETFRREHIEGPWAWKTIFRPLGLETPPQQQIAEWVEKQGCSTLESLVGEEPVEVEGIVVEAQADITDAIETQQVEGKAT